MKFCHAIGLTMAIFQVSASDQLDGWYPCAEYTFSDEGTSSGQKAECAIYMAPMCYPGICDSPKSQDSKVDIFVKRLPAVSVAEKATNVWLIEGGPGAPTTGFEEAMLQLHAKLNGTANVYTMEHRGTGRSTLFDCVAAQVQTTGSPHGRDIDPTEVASCAKALEFKYDNYATFSITSAATDLSTLISKYTNGASTVVYGVSYGSTVVERLMFLNPPEVVGYVMDGISTTSATSADKFQYFSVAETDYGEVGDHLLGFCAQDSVCSTHFANKSLPDTLEDLLTQFDKDPNSTCATLVDNKASGDVKPSFKLRKTLGELLSGPEDRTLIPPIVYRLNRCSPEDVDVMSSFFDVLNGDSNPSQNKPYFSNLLFFLIVFSEMWEIPGPSVAEMNPQFASTKLSDGSVYQLALVYCAFSKEKSSWCEELGVGDYDAKAIMYERDQYWNKSTTIPSQASALLLSSKLDPITPHKYAEHLLEVLEGDNKELVTFNYTRHGTVAWSFPIDNVYTGETCGMNVLASYVSSGGDLQKLDRS
ncbi:hypothetical protein PF005_g28875, partial [Phytophthora fragariae]